jgi:hypothetical protein
LIESRQVALVKSFQPAVQTHAVVRKTTLPIGLPSRRVNAIVYAVDESVLAFEVSINQRLGNSNLIREFTRVGFEAMLREETQGCREDHLSALFRETARPSAVMLLPDCSSGWHPSLGMRTKIPAGISAAMQHFLTSNAGISSKEQSLTPHAKRNVAVLLRKGALARGQPGAAGVLQRDHLRAR